MVASYVPLQTVLVVSILILAAQTSQLPLFNLTCSAFQCETSEVCIPQNWVCDGQTNCRDGSDERGCHKTETIAKDWNMDMLIRVHGICFGNISRCEEHFLRATSNGSIVMAQIMLRYGVDVNTRGNHGMTGLMLAAFNGDTEMVRTLLDEGADIEATPNNGNLTSLLFAVQYEKLDTAKMLLKRGADIEAQDALGRNALYISCTKGYKEFVKYLLDQGADIQSRDIDGLTPLHKAAASGQNDIVTILLDRGAAIEARDNYGHTSLMRAVSDGRSIGLLISRGAFIDARTQNGQTALMIAARFSYSKSVRELVKRGASVNAVDDNGRTALWWATNGDDTVYQTLRRNGAEFTSEMTHFPGEKEEK